MPRIEASSFSNVVFDSEEELNAAKTFSDINRLYLISRRTEIAEQKIRLLFDPAKQQEWIQNEAAMAGKIALLDELIGD